MSENDDSGSLEEIPGDSIGDVVLENIKTLYGRYMEIKSFVGNYLPFAERSIELIMAIVLLVGFGYWLHTYFILGG